MNKFFEVNAKCGHVGKRKCVNISFPVAAENAKEAAKKCREFNSNKDDLIIIAGACQSYYEILIKEGANFASSPTRSNIHLLDPIIVASFIANYRISEKIDIEYILSNTISKSLGGIESVGKARKLFVGGK